MGADNYHRGFEYHHLKPKSLGGSDAPTNLILLCHACHSDLHRSRDIDLPAVADVAPDFTCRNCGAGQDPDTVEMNCGWYKCGQCQQVTHLFDHFMSEK